MSNAKANGFWSVERIFICLFLVFGFTLAWLVPPGWNNDEREHTFRAQQISTGQFVSTPHIASGHQTAGGHVPTALVQFFDDVKTSNIATKKPNSFAENAALNEGDNGRTSLQAFANTALYSPIAYIPQAFAFWAGQIYDLSYFWIIIIGRMLGVLVVGLTVFYAIRYIKIGKWILFAVALLPSFVIQAATLGADAMLLALIILFVTCIVNLLFTEKISHKQLAGLMLVSGALAMVKSAYLPFLLLLPALPLINNKLRRWHEWLKLTVPFVGAVILGLLWVSTTNTIDVVNYQANRELQQNFIFSQPGLYITVLFNTFFTELQTGMYKSLVGSFIWNTAPLPTVFVATGIIVTVLSVFVQDKREKFREFQQRIAKNMSIFRWMTLIVAVASTLLTVTAVYVYFTTPYRTSIDGVQGRYFLPLLPLILIGLYGNPLKNQDSVKRFIVLGAIIVQLGAVAAIYMRLYETVPKFY